MKKYVQIILFLLTIFLLLSCASGPAKKNDLLKLRQQAEQAYTAGNLNEAEKYFLLLTEQLPEEADYWFRLGNIYARTHQPDKAITAFEEALLRDSKNAKAWHNMGIVYLRQAANAFTVLLADLQPEDSMYDYVLEINENIIQLLTKKIENPPAEKLN